jgi:hypothetical protein
MKKIAGNFKDTLDSQKVFLLVKQIKPKTAKIAII